MIWMTAPDTNLDNLPLWLVVRDCKKANVRSIGHANSTADARPTDPWPPSSVFATVTLTLYGSQPEPVSKSHILKTAWSLSVRRTVDTLRPPPVLYPLISWPVQSLVPQELGSSTLLHLTLDGLSCNRHEGCSCLRLTDPPHLATEPYGPSIPSNPNWAASLFLPTATQRLSSLSKIILLYRSVSPQ